jgi:hypothetical protein
MLRKVIARGVTGLGISAVAMVPSAVPEENPLQLLEQQISRLTEAIQRRMATDEERFRRIEEDIRELKQRRDNSTSSVQPTVEPHSVPPHSVPPHSVQPRSVEPRYVKRRSVQPNRHCHNSCPPPWWEPWW